MTTQLAQDIAARTDVYFNRTRDIVRRFGDKRVTYAIFLRRPVISAPRLMLDWLQQVAAERGTRFQVDVTHPEGSWTGAGEPLIYLTGQLTQLADLETGNRLAARGRRQGPAAHHSLLVRRSAATHSNAAREAKKNHNQINNNIVSSSSTTPPGA